MSSVRRQTYYNPLPSGAVLTSRGGRRIALWKGRDGRKREAPVIERPDGALKIQLQTDTYLGRFRSAEGTWVERSTGCRTREAAEAVLADWVREEERIRTGVVTRAELSAAEHMTAAIEDEFAAYLAAPIRGRKGSRRSAKHVENIGRALRAVAADLRWSTLRDLEPRALRGWVTGKADSGMSPRTVEAHLAAWRTLIRWLRQEGRFVGDDPLAGVHAPRHEDRRKPRALTEAEIESLLAAARLRSLRQASRITRGPKVGQLGARLGPATQARLERAGRERWLAYRVMLLTGLRAGELAAVRVADLDLEADPPTLHLDGSRTKNGEPAAVALRADLAADLRSWIDDILGRARERARKHGEAVPARLDPALPLLAVPALREVDKDLSFAEVPKRVRGLTACRHSLRHSTATLLGKLGAPPQLISAWMRHRGDTLAERTYTDRTALDVLAWLGRLPAWRGTDDEHGSDASETATARATGTDDSAAEVARVLTRVLTRAPGHSSPFESSRDRHAETSDRRNSRGNHALAPAAVVGEKGLEPSTRSTQSYASTN